MPLSTPPFVGSNLFIHPPPKKVKSGDFFFLDYYVSNNLFLFNFLYSFILTFFIFLHSCFVVRLVVRLVVHPVVR
nr:MAG TPA: hypothetical protein [Caudoviricetes sp.]